MLRKPHKLRVVMLGVAFFALGGVVAARLAHLQVVRHAEFAARADGQHTKRVVIQAERGDILDRRGRALATSTGSLSVYVDGRFMPSPEQVDLERLAGQVSYYAGESPTSILRKLNRQGVTTLARQLEPLAAERIGDLLAAYGVSQRAWWFHRESKRLYPRGLAPHVIGFTGTDGDGDNRGLAGLELAYQGNLQGERIESTTFRTGARQVLQPYDPHDLLAARGHTLVTTLDAPVQEAAEEAVRAAAEEFSAAAAGVIAMDVTTGGVLALAVWPDFDNANHGRATDEQRRNRILTDPFEPGSVAKLWTAGMLLDAGLIGIDTLVDCEGGAAVVDGRRLRDSPGHYLDVVPFYEVIRHSSNVGSVKAALALEDDQWHRYLRAFGFGSPTGIDLGGEGGGLLYPTSRWSRLSRTSLPMGYEIGVTPLQTVTAVAALVNGGRVLRPHIVQEIRNSHGDVVYQHEVEVMSRPIGPAASALMRELMEDVVLHGTGKKAQTAGFRVGGKTGTTRKSHIHTHREYISSFAGALPIEDPRIAVYCFVDSPQGAYYASTVAAPIFRKVAAAAVLQLGLTPTGIAPSETAFAPGAGDGPDARPRPEVPPGTMPDLAGMTVGQVRRVLPVRDAAVRLIGSGSAVDQFPPAGADLADVSEVVVVFHPEAGPAWNRSPIIETRRGQ